MRRFFFLANVLAKAPVLSHLGNASHFCGNLTTQLHQQYQSGGIGVGWGSVAVVGLLGLVFFRRAGKGVAWAWL